VARWIDRLTGVPETVAAVYLGEPPADRNELAVRAGGHVAVGQRAGKRVRRRLELQGQDVGESAFFGFDDGAGVMGDQPAQHSVSLMDVAQVLTRQGHRAGADTVGDLLRREEFSLQGNAKTIEGRRYRTGTPSFGTSTSKSRTTRHRRPGDQRWPAGSDDRANTLSATGISRVRTH
jgi:hypothetical protein